MENIFWRYNAAIKQIVYSSFRITEENIPYYIESLNKYKPDSIDGFISSIYDISTGVIENIENSDEVLVASFTTYGIPLIRYGIGDSMVFEDNDILCECGLETLLIKSIQGRTIDFLYSTNGAKINFGNIDNIFKNIPNTIIKSMIIQNSLTHLVVKIVVDDNFNNQHTNMLIVEIKHKFGNSMMVDIEIVYEIAREKSGKYSLIRNNIK